MEKDITRQVENAVDYYKNTDNLEEIPIDILRAMYKDNLSELENYKTEHKIMKIILVKHNLWETLLNDDEFIEYLNK